MLQYRLNTTKDNNIRKRFTREELLEMTTLQLRNICFEEKIVKGVVHTLDRDNLIRTIMKYRGAEESYLIKTAQEGCFQKIEKIIKKHLVTKLPDHEKIKIPAKITLYTELGITKDDLYKVTIENNTEESNVLLLDEDKTLCGIFNLIKDETQKNSYYLVVDRSNLRLQRSNNRNYFLVFFKKEQSEYLFKTYYSDKQLPPTNLEYYEIPLIDLEVKELEETATVLAIDFGTSNTTAGAFISNNYIENPCNNDILNGRLKLNEINFVHFMTGKDEKSSEVLPTVVYVADCAKPEQIKYYFGYEARELMKKNDYTSHASVFQGIKRWVNNYAKIEEIFDEAGNVAYAKRGEIIRAYILQVIQTAERQFKCKFYNIHISSPVKMKQQFIDMFQEIIPEYKVVSEDVLDEGIAVLYNTIADQIEKNKFVDGKEYKALVIDCGGGTTDLSSCAFKINEGYISYKIEIDTAFENGDTNFGGNNITHRILQFMKIVFAHYYRSKKEVIDIDSLIDIPNADIFRFVDEFGVNRIYEQFEERYQEAEAVIPTRFKEYENRVRDEYQRVRNNFYFLWEIADNMKKEFFQKTNILRNKFNFSDLDDQASDLHITTLNKWCLSVLENEAFKYEYEFPNVIFNIKEINKLIKADIYEIVRRFLEKFYENRELQDYSIIKLTGQSCRIDIFKEALKEFVPGRSIEFKQKKEEDEIIPDLKLSCLRGVLRYINAKAIGEIEVKINNEIPVIPYSVSALTYNKQEKILICSLAKLNQVKGYISRPIGVTEVRFYLKSQEGILREEYVYENDLADYLPILADDFSDQYDGKILQEDTDTIRNGEIRFFLFASCSSWGFQVLPVARKEDQLLVGKKKFFAFEGELSELDFFDGLK